MHELGEDSFYEIRGAVFGCFSEQGAERFELAGLGCLLLLPRMHEF